MSERPTRHILSLSGGKDSTALAIHMRDRVADMEYVFCDTGEELPETYEYLDRIEAYLGRPIVRLMNKRHGFSDLLEARRGFLPSPQARWCTQYLKIKPFEDYVGNDPVVSYIAIRADELHRKGYISSKPNIKAIYPFIDDGISKDDVYRLLEDSGLGLPEYYKWRSRSGCYFCFFQQRNEWVGLLENHPELYRKSMAFERVDNDTGERFTWSGKESLAELAKPERIEQIRFEAARREAASTKKGNGRLLHVLEEDDDDASCLICHL
jgi:3'-phosphoadenosine 5'-phosphosulfate sulfotransferase (PAPS reductase)/FAD synthetase